MEKSIELWDEKKGVHTVIVVDEEHIHKFVKFIEEYIENLDREGIEREIDYLTLELKEWFDVPFMIFYPEDKVSINF